MFLRDHCYLKRLEEPHVYDIQSDELYLLDEEGFHRILALQAGGNDPEAGELLREAGLAQESPRSGPPFFEGSAADPSLRYLEVQITGRCDKACRHCYLGPPDKRDMDRGTFHRILEEFTAAQGLKVMVSGGEPACHPLFREMSGDLGRWPMRRVLITHGEWIGPREARDLRDVYHQVQVSLDGWQEGHDRLRGPGSFARAVEGIRALRSAGVPVSAATMVHRHNLDEFQRMDAFLREMGVQEWSIDVPCPAGRWAGEDLEPEQLRAMSEKLRHAYGGGFHGGARGLSCGSHLMTVGPDGTAAKCGFYFHEPAGNVREGLARVWERVPHVPLSSLRCRCPQLAECAGGCRFRAQVLEGSPLAPDIVQCYARGVE
ncbi:MAG: radical SAM protein [bacterium]|nr:MAG: radical SAM protein [bacterium]